MSIFHDKALKGVAEAAAKIMAETSHGSHPKTDKEKSLAALAHPKDKITHKDVLVGRGVIKKEEVEQLDEVGDTPAGRKALGSYVIKAIADKTKDRTKGLRKATSRMYKDDYYGKKNEEVEATEQEQLNEAFPTVADAKKRMDAGKTATGSVTKTATGLVHKRDFEHNAEDDDHPEKVGRPKGHGYGARQNYKRSTRVNESASFTEMLELYNEHGLKVLAPIETEEMNIDGTMIEVIDADKVNGVVATEIEEGIMDVAKGAAGVVKDVISKERAYQAQKQQKAGEVMSKLRKEESLSEEPTNDEFTKEFEDQKASFEGKKKQPKVAAGKTTGVKVMPEEVELDEEQLDELSKDTYKSYLGKTRSLQKAHHAGSQLSRYARTAGDRGYKEAGGVSNVQDRELNTANARKHAKKMLKKEEVEQIDERELTTGEAKKKEEYVKGMKKGLSGFKQRYGERAKSVMYATATKMAKKD